MGHSRIGTLPATHRWDEVVDFISNGADVSKVAERTLWASEKALSTTKNDVGFREAMHLLVQLALAGKSADAVEHLAGVGVEFGNSFSGADLAAAVSSALDRRMEGKGNRSDWGEMARGALVSTISELLAGKGDTLFAASRADLTAELRPLHREKQFGALGRSFFGTLANKFLNYFLSKTLTTHVGAGQRFPTMNEYAGFKQAMQKHCSEAAVIVEKFCGQWLQKRFRENEGKASRADAEALGAYAIEKMQLELAARAKRDGK